MFQIVYQFIWLLAIILLAPIYLYRVIVKGKYRTSTLARLGFQHIPKFSDKKVIWMHSVSLGESQISDQFAQTLKTHIPDVFIVASSCTETGQAVLKQSKHIDFCFYYPADFIFLINKLFTQLKPKAILIMETDLWPNMLRIADKKSIPVFVLNAKISESTFKRYQQFPFIKKQLLDSIEHLFSQCRTYDERFEKLALPAQTHSISGNIKLDRYYPQKSPAELNALVQHLGFDINAPIIVFASTHEGEEQGFINTLNFLHKKVPALQVIFVPRHPERFREVAKLLNKNSIVFKQYSELENKQVSEHCKCMLLDKMGVLMDMYAIATIAVVAGSFTDKVGGHNIFEPAFFAKPIIYGPWIFKQPGFHDLIQERQAAIQIQEHDWQVPLEKAIVTLLENPSLREQLGKAAQTIVQESQGSSVSILKKLALDFPKLFS